MRCPWTCQNSFNQIFSFISSGSVEMRGDLKKKETFVCVWVCVSTSSDWQMRLIQRDYSLFFFGKKNRKLFSDEPVLPCLFFFKYALMFKRRHLLRLLFGLHIALALMVWYTLSDFAHFVFNPTHATSFGLAFAMPCLFTSAIIFCSSFSSLSKYAFLLRWTFHLYMRWNAAYNIPREKQMIAPTNKIDCNNFLRDSTWKGGGRGDSI